MYKQCSELWSQLTSPVALTHQHTVPDFPLPPTPELGDGLLLWGRIRQTQVAPPAAHKLSARVYPANDS